MSNEGLTSSPHHETELSGSSDEFELPVSPPAAPCRQEFLSVDSSKVTEDPVPTHYVCTVDPCSAAIEQHPQRNITEEAEIANSLNRNATASLITKSNDAEVPEMPASTIDDHPLVAAVIVLLLILSTGLIGAISIATPFFWIFLLAIYWIGYDFFRKRRSRKELRRQISERSSNAT